MKRRKKRAKRKAKPIKDEGYMTIEKLKAYMDFATKLKIAQEQRKNRETEDDK